MQRHLGVNYRTAWYLCHRIRAAMQDGDTKLLGTVEIDETYVGGKVLRRGSRHKPRKEKDVVLGMIERSGRLRLVPVPDAKAAILQPVLEKNIGRQAATIYTDEPDIHLRAGRQVSREARNDQPQLHVRHRGHSHQHD